MQLSGIETIVYLAGNLFRIYIISRMLLIFFGEVASTKRRIVRFFLYIFYFILNSSAFFYFMWPPKAILFTNIVGTIAVVMTYQCTWKYRSYAVVASLALHTICEDLCYYFLVFCGVEHILIVGIISADILFFLLVTVMRKYVDFKKQVEVTFFEWVSIFAIPIFSLFISTIVLDRCNDEVAVAVGEISLIFEMLLLFFLLDHVQNLYKEKLDNSVLKEQNKAYQNQMLLSRAAEEKLMSFRHDIKNHLITLEQLAKEDECTEIQDYLKELVTEVESAKTYVCTGNHMIDSFLNMKLDRIKNLGADLNLKLGISNNIRIKPKDICIILGNLLDNSINALEKCNGEKKFKLSMKESQGQLYLKIENSFEGIIQKRGNTILTSKSKKEGHGIGLKNVQKTIDLYHGQMDIDYTHDMFSVRIMIFI